MNAPRPDAAGASVESAGPSVPVAAATTAGWKRSGGERSLPESNSTVAVPRHFGFWRKLLAFSGPGYLVAVGYMDPGNWATDLAGGSRFGYTLLSVVLLSNLMAILLQSLCARLGIATGRDLAQACRDHYSRPTNIVLWILCEVAICACDLAEVIGSAIALKLLFGIPLVAGVCLTSLDVLVVMWFANRSFRWLEVLVVTLILLIGGCFLAQILMVHPVYSEVFAGFLPRPEIVSNPAMLYIAIGILGATVMPHNLYLHSSIVQTRKYERTAEGRGEAIRFATIDSTVALMSALFINAGILIVAAAAFHKSGVAVDGIEKAHELLAPLLGAGMASLLFAVALLASGQNSTLTGTLAGQIVMEGFLNLRMRPWLRRLATRAMAIIPAAIVAAVAGDAGAEKMLVLSQVILSLQLPFAVVPLVLFTGDRAKMGEFVAPAWVRMLAWLTAATIIVLNAKLLVDVARSAGH